MSPIIEAREVVLSFGQTPALRGASITAELIPPIAAPATTSLG